ncbi:hypothetical protein ACI6Q2_00060 [Chitinophagaceae bacterium LWZ2-11]
MTVNETIASYSTQPLTHRLLLSVLKDYRRPNDKIHELMKEGVIEPVKKGLYISGPSINANKPEPFLIANHLLGPSYISSDTALAYYGLIPERVFEIVSMTTKASREFETPMGLFSYIKLKVPYYAFGLKQIKLSENQYVMMASQEKALIDKIVTTSGITLRSQKNVSNYLLDDLRMDEADLKKFDTKAMTEWLSDAPKKESLLMVIKMINDL